MSQGQQICSLCVMDSSVPDIEFDEKGRCNYCTEFLERYELLPKSADFAQQIQLQSLIAKVQAAGAGHRYDCVVGVSGGVDSSWVLLKVVELGLRPLAVHMDNGWNTELAQSNIANLVRGLNVDLYTHVIDWEEYRQLMQAFFDADVIDIELLYDNAMIATNYQQAAMHGTRFILAGTNQATEGMRMPKHWNWLKHDKKQIKALARKFANITLRSFPAIGTLDFIAYEFLRRIRWISFLDFLPYNKNEALDILQRDFGYKPYPYKHYESIFTRFYQGYLLPNKFGVDKRRLHLATLVASSQLTRNEALKLLDGSPYASERDLELDIQYFLKKMGWTAVELETYLRRSAKSHASYPSERPLWEFCSKHYKRYARRRPIAS